MTGQDRFRSNGITADDCLHHPYIEEQVITDNRGSLG
jgi:hypothetical protein